MKESVRVLQPHLEVRYKEGEEMGGLCGKATWSRDSLMAAAELAFFDGSAVATGIMAQPPDEEGRTVSLLILVRCPPSKRQPSEREPLLSITGRVPWTERR